MNSLSDYLRLVKLADALPEEAPEGAPEIKLAILGDHSTQRLAKVLSGQLADSGFFPRIYEGSYNSITLETLGESLRQFAPTYACLAISVQGFREVFYDTPQPREHLVERYVEDLRGSIHRLQAQDCRVILNNLAFPIERQFGNHSLLNDQSLYSKVFDLNSSLRTLARETGALLLDIQYLSAQVGHENFFDERFWAVSRTFCRNNILPRISRSLLAMLRATMGRITKCVVLDLDNTLWGGVIGDDGLEGIVLGDTGPGNVFRRFQSYLACLRERGYLLAVCSKNEEAAARLPFRSHPHMILKEDHISVFLANWEDKGQNVSHIAERLNIGIDSLIVLDDSAFERNLIRTRHPAAITPELPEDPSEWVAFLEDLFLFEVTTVSALDQVRAKLYQDEARRQAAASASTSLEDYLASLNMKMVAEDVAQANLARVVQLMERTNQFNVRTQRFPEPVVRQFLAQGQEYVLRAFSLSDRFGEYGLISAFCGQVVGERTLVLLEFVMSCRVFKRGVEHAILDDLVETCRARRIETVEASFIPSAKNAFVQTLFDDLGFSLVETTPQGIKHYRLEIREFSPRPHFVEGTSKQGVSLP